MAKLAEETFIDDVQDALDIIGAVGLNPEKIMFVYEPVFMMFYLNDKLLGGDAEMTAHKLKLSSSRRRVLTEDDNGARRGKFIDPRNPTPDEQGNLRLKSESTSCETWEITTDFRRRFQECYRYAMFVPGCREQFMQGRIRGKFFD